MKCAVSNAALEMVLFKIKHQLHSQSCDLSAGLSPYGLGPTKCYNAEIATGLADCAETLAVHAACDYGPWGCPQAVGWSKVTINFYPGEHQER